MFYDTMNAKRELTVLCEELTQPIPLPPQSADVPSLEEKVRKMIDEDLVVSTFFVYKRVF